MPSQKVADVQGDVEQNLRPWFSGYRSEQSRFGEFTPLRRKPRSHCTFAGIHNVEKILGRLMIKHNSCTEIQNCSLRLSGWAFKFAWAGIPTIMREINIKIWQNDKAKDWSIDLDGALHHHVSARTIDELVEYAVIAAQQALMEQDATPSGRGWELMPN
jgi:hypothetical protein